MRCIIINNYDIKNISVITKSQKKKIKLDNLFQMK